jgi:glucan phosphoethanolaminetransferase (alkaline phosphatase superfamily)
MRGDLALRTRLLLRPRGIAGLAAAVAGATAISSLYLPWYGIVVRVTMLGETQEKTLSSLAGWQAHPWLWAIGLVGLAAGIVGVLVAVDRPLPRTRAAIVGAAAVLALLVALSALRLPRSDRFAAGAEIAELQALAERMPADVEVTLAVTTASGLWIAAASAVLLLAVALVLDDS